MTSTVTLSTLLRHPNEVIERLEEGDVVLTRRDGEDLRLSKDSEVTSEHKMVSAVAHLITRAVLDESTADRVVDNLFDPFPWIEFLPASALASSPQSSSGPLAPVLRSNASIDWGSWWGAGGRLPPHTPLASTSVWPTSTTSQAAPQLQTPAIGDGKA